MNLRSTNFWSFTVLHSREIEHIGNRECTVSYIKPALRLKKTFLSRGLLISIMELFLVTKVGVQDASN